MSETRKISLSVNVGKQGVGKTYFLLKSLFPAFVKQKGILIYDYSCEDEYAIYPLILLQDLGKWKGQGIYRIYDADPEKVFEAIYKHVRNCYLVLEDSKAYITSRPKQAIANVLGIRRQLGVDIIMNFWTLEDVPPQIYTYTNYLTIFKTADSEKKLQKMDKLSSPEILKVWKSVKRHKDPRHKVTIELN